MSEIYMMVTICNRKQMQKFVKFYIKTVLQCLFIFPFHTRLPPFQNVFAVLPV